jgi:hypothetical protein
LAGNLAELFEPFVLSSHGFAGGCAGGALGFVLVMVFASFLMSVGALAIGGFFLYWHGSQWGPVLVFVANLLNMAFFAWWTPGWLEPGQQAWAMAVLAFALAPAIACVLLLWALVRRGRLAWRLGRAVLVACLALPVIGIYGAGISSSVTTAFERPAPVTASATTHC